MDVKFYKSRNKAPGIVIGARKHILTLNMCMLFLSGLVVGSLMIRFQSPISTLVVSLFKRYNGIVVSNGFFKNLLNLLMINNVFVVALCFLGLSAVGCPFVCLFPAVKGIGIGIVSSYLYRAYSLSGFGYCTLVFYPQQIINMAALLMAMNESYYNSKMIYQTVTEKEHNSFDVKQYFGRFGLILLLTALSSIVGAILNTTLSGVFIK